LERLEDRRVLNAGPLVISELMAINYETLAGRRNDYPDWIEIHNPTDEVVSLNDWYLTDDTADLAKWQFPDVSIQPQQYLVVFASDRDSTDPEDELHTNFKLDGDGEYLALVHPDGATISHEYSPEFPKQLPDVSYGRVDVPVPLVPESTVRTYYVPSADDDALGDDWTAIDFPDGSWEMGGVATSVAITEVGTGEPDLVEIQNLRASTVDTSGWVVALNNADDAAGAADINLVHETLWHLPPSMDTGELLWRNDQEGHANYFGENLSWLGNGPGWAMIVDDEGRVADFVVWGYAPEQIESLSVIVGGFIVTANDVWQGPSAQPPPGDVVSLQRTGDLDNNVEGDWRFGHPSAGLTNGHLTVPLEGHPTAGIGYSIELPGLIDAVDTDVAALMHGLESSLWTRIPFDLPSVAGVESLILNVRYNDGFVAYLNGQPIAGRNAPAVVRWNSTATAARSVAESLVVDQIDVTEHLDLLVDGRNVLAIWGLNVDATDGDFLVLPELLASGQRHLMAPTPGGPNAVAFVADTVFWPDRGLYEHPFEAWIDCGTPGAEIRYTLDGSVPTATHGLVYTRPIPIDDTTTLRAAAFKPGYLPTNVDTQTYIFYEEVAQQTRPAGYPTSWGAEPNADYDVDPEIALNPEYRGPFIDGLFELPSMSLVLPVEDMFGPAGLYSNTLNTDMERAVSVEFFHSHWWMFQVDAGLSIQGAVSRNPQAAIKHSMSLRFRSEYGPGRFDYPLFGDSPVDRFDSLQLRAVYDNSWIHGSGAERARAQLIRDQWMRDSLLDMGYEDAGQGRYVNLYINGLYWGVYNLHERQEASHYAEYHDVDEDALTAVKGREAVDGNYAAFNQLRTVVHSGNWEEIVRVMDVDNFIDWSILQRFAGNRYLVPTENWRAIGGTDDAPWRFYSWNSERVLENVANANPTTPPDPTGLLEPLLALPEFRVRFGDRLHEHFFHDGTLTPEQNTDRWMQRAGEIEAAIVGESARWGDDRREPPYTLDDWMAERNRLVNQYFPVRSDLMIGRYRAEGLYPQLDAVEFYVNGTPQHGGQIEPNGELGMSAGGVGTIYYTLDGSDPRQIGGAVSPAAIAIGGPTIVLPEGGLVRARVYDAGQWSALSEAQFFLAVPASVHHVSISELNYNPHDPTPAELAVDPSFAGGDFEFVELRNHSGERIDLSGVKFVEGIEFDLIHSDVEILEPGELVVVVRNRPAFEARYGTELPIAGQYLGDLDDDGEQIVLSDWTGTTSRFHFDNRAALPDAANGKGASLDVTLAWSQSAQYGGSPGTADPGPFGDVVINEVLSAPLAGERDAIELYNTTEEPADVGGWYLSNSWGWATNVDNGDYKKFRIPDDTLIPPGGYAVFDEADFNPTGGANPQDFTLDGVHGDDVWLMEADAAGNLTRFVDRVEFGPAIEGESWGRWPDADGRLYPQSVPTLDKARPEDGTNLGPRVGPVVISEVHYHPRWGRPGDPDLGEFVEIHNPGDASVDMGNWRLRGGIIFDVAEGVQLAPDESLVAVPFDPNDPDVMDEFVEFHDIDPAVQIIGPYSGQLADVGEWVQLQRPGESPHGEPGYVPYTVEDEVRYDDRSGWPRSADGRGSSLQRKAPELWGNDATNWVGGDPTPGAVQWTPTVVGRHVFYNNSAFDGNSAVASPEDDAAIAPHKRPLLPGETATFANYTSYALGINGIMVDLANLPGQITIDDLAFFVGNDADPASWASAPQPSFFVVRSGAGVAGSSRVTVTWDDSAIRNQWLQVRVLATENTGLRADDVFYFGNAVGEAGNSVTNTQVTPTDVLLARNNPRNFLNPATINFPYDYNRDQRVTTTDVLMARNNQTNFLTALTLLDLSPVGDQSEASPQLSSLAPAWLPDYDLPGRSSRPAAKPSGANEAIDALLATL